MKRPLFSVLIVYLVGALTVGFVYFNQTSYSTNGKDRTTAVLDAGVI